MAYMNQEKKAVIAANLKKVMPKDWKYSLSVDNHSSIVLTIKSAPVDLNTYKHGQVNHYYLDDQFSGDTLDVMNKIKDALYSANYHNRSDIQSDYHDVAYYVNIHLGKWNKPFVCTGV